jgi:hypothetical protein
MQPRSKSLVHGEELEFGQEMSEQQFLEWAHKRLARSKDFFDPIWKEAQKLWQVKAAESFTEDEKEFMTETGRPLIDPPFAAGIIETVLGAEMGQQSEAVFRGVDEGFEDEVIADWLTKLVKKVNEKTRGLTHDLEAYQDMLVGGYGFTAHFLDKRKRPSLPRKKALNFWQVFPDPDAVEMDLEDATYFFIETKWQLEDAQAEWPEHSEKLRTSFGTGGKPPGATPQAKSFGSMGGGADDKPGVTIYEMQYRRGRRCARWVDPETGETIDGDRKLYDDKKAELDAARKAVMQAYEQEVETWSAMAEAEGQAMQEAELMGMPPPPSMLPPQPVAPPLDQMPQLADEDADFYRGYVWRRAYLCGDDAKKGARLADDEIEVATKADAGPTIKCITGYPWKQPAKERVRYYGLMRKIYHIQFWYTRAIQLYLEIQTRKVKGGGFADKRAFNDKQAFDDFVKKSSTPGQWFWVNETTGITMNQPLSGEPGVMEILKAMEEMFGLISLVPQALQGTLASDRSNVMVSNMQERALQGLAPIREPRIQYLRASGKMMAAMCVAYLPVAVIDRLLGVQKVEGMTVETVVGPDGVKAQQPIMSEETGPDGQPVPMTAGKILKSADVLCYDVTVDVGVATANQKLAFWEGMQQHGVLEIIKESLPGPEGTKVWLEEVLLSAPLPAARSKKMADKAVAFLDKMMQQGTAEGILSGFQELLAQDPEAAQGLFDQVTQVIQAQAPPEQPMPEQAM